MMCSIPLAVQRRPMLNTTTSQPFARTYLTLRQASFHMRASDDEFFKIELEQRCEISCEKVTQRTSDGKERIEISPHIYLLKLSSC